MTIMKQFFKNGFALAVPTILIVASAIFFHSSLITFMLGIALGFGIERTLKEEDFFYALTKNAIGTFVVILMAIAIGGVLDLDGIWDGPRLFAVFLLSLAYPGLIFSSAVIYLSFTDDIREKRYFFGAFALTSIAISLLIIDWAIVLLWGTNSLYEFPLSAMIVGIAGMIYFGKEVKKLKSSEA